MSGITLDYDWKPTLMGKLSMICRFKTEHGKSRPRLLHLGLGAKKNSTHEADDSGWARMWKQ
jgi:hypothetical protein